MRDEHSTKHVNNYIGTTTTYMTYLADPQHQTMLFGCRCITAKLDNVTRSTQFGKSTGLNVY